MGSGQFVTPWLRMHWANVRPVTTRGTDTSTAIRRPLRPGRCPRSRPSRSRRSRGSRPAYNSYPVAGSRTMATQVAATNTFRLDFAGLQSASFRSTLNGLLKTYVQCPGRLPRSPRRSRRPRRANRGRSEGGGGGGGQGGHSAPPPPAGRAEWGSRPTRGQYIMIWCVAACAWVDTDGVDVLVNSVYADGRVRSSRRRRRRRSARRCGRAGIPGERSRAAQTRGRSARAGAEVCLADPRRRAQGHL